jgi:hypothetical protein
MDDGLPRSFTIAARECRHPFSEKSARMFSRSSRTAEAPASLSPPPGGATMCGVQGERFSKRITTLAELDGA